MKQRCFNETNRDYRYYGAKGITVCDRWLDFWSFVADMGERPKGHSLDRINNEGPYAPGNCRWASAKQQARNRRNTVYVEVSGKPVALSELASVHGVSAAAARARLRNGHPVDVVLSATTLPRGDAKAGIAASAAKRRAITHCPRGHEYTAENTIVEAGCRRCRLCHNERQKLRARERRAKLSAVNSPFAT